MSIQPIRRTVIGNVYRVSEAVRDLVPWRMGATMGDYAPSNMAGNPLLSMICNGRKVGAGERPNPGDQISFVVMPAAGISIGAAILISSIVSVGLGFVTYLLMGRPDMQEGLGAESPSYSFSGIGNTVAPGSPIPVGYGQHLVGGQVIGQFRRTAEDGSGDSQLWVLLALGHGPYSSIAGFTEDTDWTDATNAEGLTINGNDASTFDGCYIAVRMGDMDQEAIPDFDKATVNQNVGIELRQYEPITITTSQAAKKIELNINFPQGQQNIHPHGHRRAWPIQFRYRYRPTDGGWSNWTAITVDRGFYRQAFVSTISFDLPEENTAEVELERLTFDGDESDSSNTYIGTTIWDSINLITYDSYTYPGVALLALKTKASRQINDPNITILSECDQMKVGVWDGVMQEFPTWFKRFTRNPAWIALDILRNEVYGLGNYLDAAKHIDLASFEAWADYCDELVDDGRGGTEERHRFDGRFDAEEGAWESFLKVCRVGRAIPIKVGGKIRIKINQARDAIQVIGMGNIKEGTFKKQWLSLDDRFNIIHCKFRDAELNWEQDVATVEKEDLWANDETILERNEEFFGVTRRTEVMREGMFAIKCNQFLREIIEFEMGVEGLASEAGDVIYVAHDVAAEHGISGRISTDCTVDYVKLDRECYFASGATYKVIVQDADDDTIEERTIDMAAGIYEAGEQLDVSSSFSFIPSQYDNFILYRTTTAVREYMIAEVSETQGLERKVKCLLYDEDVYDLSGGVTPDGVPESDEVDNVPPRIREDSSGDINASTTVFPEEVVDVHVTALQISGRTRTALIDVALDIDPESEAQSHSVFIRETGDEHWTEIGLIEMPEMSAQFDISFAIEQDGALVGLEVIARPNLPNAQQAVTPPPSSITPTEVESDTVPDFWVIGEDLIA